jgi:K+-transporting ATPase ATPase A chain
VTIAAWGQLALYSVLVLLVTKPLGIYMARVFEGDRQPLPRLFGPVERFLFRLSGVDPKEEQSWVRYAGSVMIFSLCGVLVTYGILRLQQQLPLNPQKFGAVDPALAFNTSASFTTNTNWQAYSGESTMTTCPRWRDWPGTASLRRGGIAIAIALARGLTRRLAWRGGPSATSGRISSAARSTSFPLQSAVRPGAGKPG